MTRQDAMEWPLVYFGNAQLGDLRRSKDGCNFLLNSGASLPQQLSRWSDAEGAIGS